MAPSANRMAIFLILFGAAFLGSAAFREPRREHFDMEDDGSDETASLFQKPFDLAIKGAAAERGGKPYLIPLRRESVPIYRRGKVASFKTSYSGIVNVGTPAQEFRVVFDTGSGNIVLPAVECKSESCLIHRTYNMSASSTSKSINLDGQLLKDGDLADQVTIGFGTGEITGEFSRDKVCIGGGGDDGEKAADSVVTDLTKPSNEACLDMNIIVAVEMTTQPFKTFHFDGILGMGLGSLAMTEEFSTFSVLSRTTSVPHFGVFLTEGEDDEVSEIALGGHNPLKVLEPLTWAPVAMAELGYWQVEILAVRIGGELMDICEDGTCRGVVDTGTSHLGLPKAFNPKVVDLVTRDAGDLLDCRLAQAPEIQIELRGYNITLQPHNYMRRLPLREGVSVGSANGVHMNSSTSPNNAPPPDTATESNASPNEQATAIVSNMSSESSNAFANGGTNASANGTEEEGPVKRFCSPRSMAVSLPEPLGPKLFILGEPVLHRYYTVYDWQTQQVGFGLANTRRNTMDPSELISQRGELPKEVDMLLMQQRVERVRRSSTVVASGGEPAVARMGERKGEDEGVVLMQLGNKVTKRAHKRVTGAKAAQAEDDEEDEGASFAQTVKNLNTGPRKAGRQEFYAAQQAALELETDEAFM